MSGYLLLGQHLLEGNKSNTTKFNFGPENSSCVSVGEMVELIKSEWPKSTFNLGKVDPDNFHEAGLLKLNSEKAKNILNWHPVWDLNETLSATINWYKHREDHATIDSRKDLQRFIDSAQSKDLIWTK
ncbi:MAG: hypothetical protein HRT57_06845 [Crocinitomicaceae bacterium]|nr:hypothetical protein [Crocinitomicaceae bacterium]